ncbi:hypothetical protein NEOKW01_1081 [Nematocida sp. AWRm80]|nr:hypothetical protein NEOKW01_1081 [Nematocida sp. AWRm80]
MHRSFLSGVPLYYNGSIQEAIEKRLETLIVTNKETKPLLELQREEIRKEHIGLQCMNHINVLAQIINTENNLDLAISQIHQLLSYDSHTNTCIDTSTSEYTTNSIRDNQEIALDVNDNIITPSITQKYLTRLSSVESLSLILEKTLQTGYQTDHTPESTPTTKIPITNAISNIEDTLESQSSETVNDKDNKTEEEISIEKIINRKDKNDKEDKDKKQDRFYVIDSDSDY